MQCFADTGIWAAPRRGEPLMELVFKKKQKAAARDIDNPLPTPPSTASSSTGSWTFEVEFRKSTKPADVYLDPLQELVRLMLKPQNQKIIGPLLNAVRQLMSDDKRSTFDYPAELLSGGLSRLRLGFAGRYSNTLQHVPMEVEWRDIFMGVVDSLNHRIQQQQERAGQRNPNMQASGSGTSSSPPPTPPPTGTSLGKRRADDIEDGRPKKRPNTHGDNEDNMDIDLNGESTEDA